ncbi:tetratricopeptide repeat protein [candidate division KSB1 bacterium]|nr:tetratricopeptide repeat protein [candidate division KSB1 bacterium]
MTQELGFNTNIRVGKKKLHVQTAYFEDYRQASASIFSNGTLIDKRILTLNKNMDPNHIANEIKQFHELVLSDLELLFFVAEKVQSTQIASSIEKLGHLFYEKGFFDEAVQQFQLVKKLDPNSTCCLFELGQAFYAKGDYKAAIDKLEEAIQRNPDYPDVHLLIGRAYFKRGEYAKAFGAIKHSTGLNKVYHKAFYTWGLLLVESAVKSPKSTELAPPIERLKEATDYLRTAMNLSDEYNKKIIERGIEKLDNLDQLKDALEDLEKAANQPDKLTTSTIIDSEFYLKFMFAGLDKDNKELSHYIKTIEKTVSQHPDYADLRQSLGKAYLIRGWHYFVKATEEFRSAVKINPTFETAKTKLKLLENDGRGFLILLRALLK